MRNDSVIVMFSGRAGSGKDTQADLLAEALWEMGAYVSNYAFANALKRTVAINANVDPEIFFDDRKNMLVRDAFPEAMQSGKYRQAHVFHMNRFTGKTDIIPYCGNQSIVYYTPEKSLRALMEEAGATFDAYPRWIWAHIVWNDIMGEETRYRTDENIVKNGIVHIIRDLRYPHESQHILTAAKHAGIPVFSIYMPHWNADARTRVPERHSDSMVDTPGLWPEQRYICTPDIPDGVSEQASIRLTFLEMMKLFRQGLREETNWKFAQPSADPDYAAMFDRLYERTRH